METAMPPKTITKQLSGIIFALLVGTVLLVPLFFNPFSANLFVLSKTVFLAVVTAVLIILWMAYNILTRSFRLTLTPFTLPLFLLTLVTIIASWGPLPQTIEGFINATAVPVFLFFLFVIGTTLKPSAKTTDRLLGAVITSGVVLGITAILETINFGPGKWIAALFPSLPQAGDIFLSPAGSAVILITYLIPALVIALLVAFNRKDYVQKSLYFAASAVLTAALVISAFNILPGKPNAPVFLPFGTSWQIAAENIKTPKNFLIGVGPQNYVEAFSANKTVAFNANEFWNTRFNVASNVPLHIFTTTGVLGFAAWVLLLFALFRLGKRMPQLSNTGRIILLGLATIVIINLLIPSNLVLQALFVFLLIILAQELKAHKVTGTSEILVRLFAVKKVDSQDYNPAQEAQSKLKTELLPWIIGIPMILVALFVLYGSYRVAYADVLFRRSLEAAAANDGTGTYNNQRDAITQNPFLSSYHRSYANTNLAIANSLGSQEQLSDQDRENITQLIQQAIREGRTAVIINPLDPANWETLAGIYRNLINVAEGAVDWSTASYAEAVRRDPTNPRLRIELGGIFYQLQDFESAVRIFEQAVTLKPDWANAHYNLANAYREAGRLQESAAQYDVVVSLVDPSTADYTQTLSELNAVREQLGQASGEQVAPPQPGELSQPQPLPSPLPDQEPIDLGEEAAPPTPAETGVNQPAGGFDDITGASPTPAPETTQPVEPTPLP